MHGDTSWTEGSEDPRAEALRRPSPDGVGSMRERPFIASGPRPAGSKQPAPFCCEPCAAPPRRVRFAWKAWLAPLNSVAIIVFPKCPICGATYLSLSGVAAMPLLPPLYWIFPALVLLMLAHLAMLGVLARRRRRYAGFGIAFGGTAALLLGGVAAGQGVALGIGVVFVVLGSLLGIVEASRLKAWRHQLGRLATAIHQIPTRS